MGKFKEAKIIMLPTESKINSLWLDDKGYLLSNNFLARYKAIGSFQHLYVTSEDDNILNNDFFLYNQTHDSKNPEWVITKCDSVEEIQGVGTFYSKIHHIWCKKIIATTDTMLFIQVRCAHDANHWNNVYPAQPDQQFMDTFIEFFNKGKITVSVLIEYTRKFVGKEYVDEQDAYGYDVFEDLIKIDKKTNTIFIKEFRTSWNKEEVTKLLQNFAQTFGLVDEGNKYLKENL